MKNLITRVLYLTILTVGFFSLSILDKYGLSVDAAEATSIRLEDYVRPDDDGDWSRALERAQADCSSLDPTRQVGCTIDLSCGKTYELKQTAHICTPTLIRGCGTARGMGGSRFMTRGVTAFKNRLFTGEACPFDISHRANGLLTLEHVTLHNIGGTKREEDTKAFFGIEAKAPIFLSDVHIRGYVQGINMSCDVRRDPVSGCSLSRIDGAYLDLNGHAGLYLIGGDSNAGTYTALNSMQNCRNAAQWNEVFRPTGLCERFPGEPYCTDPIYACAGIMDFSFLGSTFVGPHTATNVDVEAGSVAYPGYIFAGKSQRTVALGAYTENDQAPSFVDAVGNVFGGISNFSDVSPGFNMHGNVANGLELVNNMDPSNPATIKLGRRTNDPGTWISFSSPTLDTNYPLKLRSNPAVESYQFDVGNIGWALRIGKLFAGGSGAKLWLPNLIHQGAARTSWCFSTPDHTCP